MAEDKILTVSEFNDFIKSYLSGVGEVVVEGEISELKVSQNKWLFLTIKDKQASVEVFSLVFKIRNYDVFEQGMLVHIYGKPYLYKKTGRFSIFANQIVPAGEGALRIAFEKLKLKLEKEGLFDLERKRPLSLFPEQIGLITAKNSQAYSDFVKVLSERMGGIKIYFYPVQVQGKNSVNSILVAIDYFNRNLANLDLLVLTRGGGNLEDLLSFNDEQVVRAIFSSKIPVVCGVGHEENISLADLVADLRASTPSNAAELIVRHRTEVLRQVNDSVKLISSRIKRLLKEREYFVYNAVARLKSSAVQKIKDAYFLISRFVKEFKLFERRIKTAYTEIDREKARLIQGAKHWHRESLSKLENLLRLLKNLDYRRLLQRGFSITMDRQGKILKEIEKVKKDKAISSLLFNGKIYSKVFKTEVIR